MSTTIDLSFSGKRLHFEGFRDRLLNKMKSSTGIIRRFLESESQRSKLFKNELVAENSTLFFIPKNKQNCKNPEDDSVITMIPLRSKEHNGIRERRAR